MNRSSIEISLIKSILLFYLLHLGSKFLLSILIRLIGCESTKLFNYLDLYNKKNVADLDGDVETAALKWAVVA